jgi:hypothetical protein
MSARGVVPAARPDRAGWRGRISADATGRAEGGAVMAKPTETLLCAEGCDLLTGRDMIARWLCLSRGACDAAIRNGTVVTFRLPPRRTVFALKSENDAHWKAAAESYRAAQRIGGANLAQSIPPP